MNILFLTMLNITSIKDRGIYTDLLRQFVAAGDNVYVLSPRERREKGVGSNIIKEDKATIIKVDTLNLQKTSILEKGIGQLLLEYQFLKVVKSVCANVQFDLVLYSTPPITFYKVIKYIKIRDNTYAYLLLKDIFPQNAVDLQMIKKDGFLHKFFLKKEKKLYEVSDKIGCMSPANVEYVLKHNSWIAHNKIEENPNSIDPIEIDYSVSDKERIRKRFEIPLNKKVFVYGGNLGKPQGLDFLLSIIISCTRDDVFFLIVGTGTQFVKIETWLKKNIVKNTKLLKGLPKKDYDNLLGVCDVGMIFLHQNFTIPNFPSRLLSYLEMKMPVLAATDSFTDIGLIIESNKCGYSVEAGDLSGALRCIDRLCSDELHFSQMQTNASLLLNQDYHINRSVTMIREAYLQQKNSL